MVTLQLFEGGSVVVRGWLSDGLGWLSGG